MKHKDMKMFREMGIHAWIGRNLIHDEIITHRSKVPQIYMVESKKQELEMELQGNHKDVGIP
jgi:hypothetical protein